MSAAAARLGAVGYHAHGTTGWHTSHLALLASCWLDPNAHVRSDATPSGRMNCYKCCRCAT